MLLGHVRFACYQAGKDNMDWRADEGAELETSSMSIQVDTAEMTGFPRVQSGQTEPEKGLLSLVPGRTCSWISGMQFQWKGGGRKR